MFRKRLVRKSGHVRLRCFAVRRDSQYVAVCLDLSLAAQADTLDEVLAKLDDQVQDCLSDIFASRNLVTRPAPLDQWLYYWRLRALAPIGHHVSEFFKKFQKDVPLELKVAA